MQQENGSFLSLCAKEHCSTPSPSSVQEEELALVRSQGFGKLGGLAAWPVGVPCDIQSLGIREDGTGRGCRADRQK